MTPDPRPPRRTRATAAEWKRIRAAKLGPCLVCGDADTTLHHLVPKSLGGGDVEDNLVPLCGSGTTGCHGLVEARDRTVCALLRDSLTRAELAYVLAVKGAVFLDRYYGRRAAA